MTRKHRPRGPVQYLCPRCFSPEVDRNPILFGGPLYRCRRCGYEGAIVLEQDVESPSMVLPSGDGTS